MSENIKQAHDRFHLIAGLIEALKQDLYLTISKNIVLSEEKYDLSNVEIKIPLSEKEKKQRVKLKQELIDSIRVDYKQGLNIVDLSRKYNLQYRTLKKYLKFDAQQYRVSRKVELDKYSSFIYEQLRLGNHDFNSIFDMIKTSGYTGSYYNFHKQLTLRIHTNSLCNNYQIPRKEFVKLLYKHETRRLKLDEHNEKLLIEFLNSNDPSANIIRIMDEFRAALSSNRMKPINDWIKKYASTKLNNLMSFIKTMRKDIKAIKYQIKCPYTNGTAEGLVGKLKAIKKRTYGRCNFETLRSLIFLSYSPHYE